MRGDDDDGGDNDSDGGIDGDGGDSGAIITALTVAVTEIFSAMLRNEKNIA